MRTCYAVVLKLLGFIGFNDRIVRNYLPEITFY